MLTCIRCINEPTDGLIEIDGVRVYENGWTGVDVCTMRRHKMGVIVQSYNLIPFLTVLENVERGKSVMNLLRRLSREKNTAVIVVTHDKRMLEGFDRVYQIADGEMRNGKKFRTKDILIKSEPNGDFGKSLQLTLSE